MDKIKSFFKSRGVGYWLMYPAFVFGLVALIIYLNTGVTEFTPELDPSVTAVYIAFLVVCAVTFVFDLRMVKFLAYALGLLALLLYIVFEVNYITNLLVSIDPTAVTSGFVLTIVFGALALITALVAAILTKPGLKPLLMEEKA